MFKLAETGGYMDVIVYALIMVGGLIVNVYRNYAKRKEMEKSGVPKPQNSPRPIFPEVLFEPVFEYEVPEIPKKEEKLPVDVLLDSPVSALDTIPDKELDEKTFIEGEAVFESTKEILISAKEFVHESIEKDDLTTAIFPLQDEDAGEGFEFDVAQAVVYSEILKPKYF
jgi:hypothetical protein